MSNKTDERIQLSCDYLVIGAGTSNLSFVDTLLELLPDVTFILVDRFSRPGGHWTTAYPFVRLHQQSCSYGVNSLKLGKNRTRRGFERFDHSDRATGEEICEYYAKVVEKFKATKRVKVILNTEYRWEEDIQAHQLESSDGKRYLVACKKTVKTETQVIVPSMREVPFPTDNSVEVVPLNSLPEKLKTRDSKSKYVVLGAGKSGTDAVLYLLSQGIDQHAVTWIAPRDVWYVIRDGVWPRAVPGGRKYYAYMNRQFMKPLKNTSSVEEYFLKMEKAGSFGRIDPNRPVPVVFKGAIIDKAELEVIRKLKNIVRMGRVTSITCDEIILQHGVMPFSSNSTLFIDCMAENLYGYNSFEKDFEVFNHNRIRLGPLPMVFNPSFSAALIGYLESKFSNDAVKNKFLYFVKGSEDLDLRKLFVLNFYCQLKTIDEIATKYKDGLKFITNSRTHTDGIMHHGGMLPLLWSLFGPMKLHKKAKSLRIEIEEGKCAGIDVSLVPRREALDPEEIKSSQRPSRERKIKG